MAIHLMPYLPVGLGRRMNNKLLFIKLQATDTSFFRSVKKLQ